MGEYTFAEDGASFPMVIGHNHDGNLVCVAKAPNINATVSNVHYLKVIGKSLYYQGYNIVLYYIVFTFLPQSKDMHLIS